MDGRECSLIEIERETRSLSILILNSLHLDETEIYINKRFRLINIELNESISDISCMTSIAKKLLVI